MKLLLDFAVKNTKCFYLLLFMVLSVVTCFLQPHLHGKCFLDVLRVLFTV